MPVGSWMCTVEMLEPGAAPGPECSGHTIGLGPDDLTYDDDGHIISVSAAVAAERGRLHAIAVAVGEALAAAPDSPTRGRGFRVDCWDPDRGLPRRLQQLAAQRP